MLKVKPIITLVGLFLFAFIYYLWIADSTLKRFPSSGDEYSYLLQAQIFADGQLNAPAPPKNLKHAFATDHILNSSSVRSKYPPGWPAVLSLGKWLGGYWIIGPLVGAGIVLLVTLLLLYYQGIVAAIFAAGILILSPMAALNAASFFSHSASLFFITLGAVFLCGPFFRLNKNDTPPGEPSWIAWLAAGLCAGACFLIRPLDGLLFILALVLSCVSLQQKSLIWLCLGVFPGCAGFLIYNYFQFGSLTTTGYALYFPEFRRIYRGVQPDLMWSHILNFKVHFDWFLDFLLHVPFVFLLPWGLKTGSRLQDRLLLSLLLLNLLAIQALWNAGDSYGPRYLFIMLLPATVFSAVGFNNLRKAPVFTTNKKTAIFAMIIVIFGAGRFLDSSLDTSARKIHGRAQLFSIVEKKVTPPAVVLMESVHIFGPNWFTRNGIHRDGPIVYAAGASQDIVEALRINYPGRTLYRYTRQGDVAKIPDNTSAPRNQ